MKHPEEKRIRDLEAQSLEILRTAATYARPVMLWTGNKDSTVALWLLRKAFAAHVPYPVLHVDSGTDFAECYDYRRRLSSEWNLDFQEVRSHRPTPTATATDDLPCCGRAKVAALRAWCDDYAADALVVAIRRDEHNAREDETIISPRDAAWQPIPEATAATAPERVKHVRIHPLLHWTELDIWLYYYIEELPVNPLYFARDGQRYRSLGCRDCSRPVDSQATTLSAVVSEIAAATGAERQGRSQLKDADDQMRKLRSVGYL